MFRTKNTRTPRSPGFYCICLRRLCDSIFMVYASGGHVTTHYIVKLNTKFDNNESIYHTAAGGIYNRRGSLGRRSIYNRILVIFVSLVFLV